MSTRRWLQVCVALWLTLVLVGCTSRELDFEVIGSVSDTPRTICDDEPGLFVLASPEEISSSGLETRRDRDVIEQLHALNYSRHFAVAVCRGLMGMSNPSLTPDVRQITRDGDKVIVRAHFQDAKEVLSKEGGMPMESWPYQLVVVTKKGRWGRDIRFVLEVDGKEVQERAHFIP